jgi:predicted phosphodiesterase
VSLSIQERWERSRAAVRRALIEARRAAQHARRSTVRRPLPAVRLSGRTRAVATHPQARRAGRWLGVVAVALAGVVLGVLLGGAVSADVGPFRAEMAVTPSLSGGSEVVIPPLGSLHLHSHAGPAHLVVRLQALDQRRTKALVTDPSGLDRASVTAVEDLGRGVKRLALQVAGVSVLGAMALAAMVYRSMRRVAACGVTALAMLAATGVVSVTTFRASAVEEPRYEGLLTNAPAVVGDARRIAGQYTAYRTELQRLVQNVGRIYGAVSSLPVYEPDTGTLRVLHISDMHLSPTAWSVVQTVVQQFSIDLVIDTGDITDWGSEPEASYVASIAALKVPYVFIRGNHDSRLTAAAVARQPNAIVLDNSTATVDGLVIAGIGDPRFTPDKSAAGNDPAAADATRELVLDSGRRLAATMAQLYRPPDVALVHDPVSAVPLAGHCPVVLAGHTHKRDVRRLDTEDAADGANDGGNDGGASPPAPRTLLMVEGSTGGAGLRGLEKTEPLPLALSILYFDSSHELQAYDDISVGGTGQTEVTLQRHIVRPDDGERPSPGASPQPS